MTCLKLPVENPVEYRDNHLIIRIPEGAYEIHPDSCTRLWNAGSDFARCLEKDPRYRSLEGDIFQSLENKDVLIVVHGGSAYEIYKPLLEPCREIKS